MTEAAGDDLARLKAKMQPERIRATLGLAGLYQITHGLIQQAMLDDLHAVFWIGFDEKGGAVSMV